MSVSVPSPRDASEARSRDGARRDEPTTVVRSAADIPAAPPPELRYRRALRFGTALRDLWRSRHVVWSLAVRELRSTYNQEILGVAWALLAPFTLMIVFTFLFERVGNVNTGGVPYPLFSYIGLVPWTFYSNAVSTAGTSLVNQPLLNKVYAPREVFPLAEVVTAGVGAVCATFALVFLFLFEGRGPSATSYWALPLVVLLVAFTVASALFTGSITVYLRDLRHALPLVLQLGLFVTPVVYGLREFPVGLRAPYVAVNPLGGIIDGLRESVLFGRAPHTPYLVIETLSCALYLLGTYMLFKRLETGFADVS